MSEKVGFVGVGRMGANMARRLKDVGYTVSAVYDINASIARELAAEIGATAPEKLAGVTAACDVIITVVTDDMAMRAIFATSGDSLLIGATGKIFINTATITPGVHVEMDKLIVAAGATAVEACMASSIPQARNGELYLMCAGDEGAYAHVKPMLEKMSVSIRWIGGPGRAAQVKALVNMLMNINTAGLAEALGLGDALGLDLTLLREVFSQTGANSRVLATDGEDMQNREHDTYFSAAHAAKDSGIALELGHGAGLILPLAEATKKQYDLMVESGLGDLDKSGIAELTFNDRRPLESRGRLMVATSTTRTIDLGDGDATTLEQWGESGPALVCVHGIGSSRKDWVRTAEALAGSYRVFAYDQRGHGDSAHVHGPMTHEQSLLDLTRVADAVGGGVFALLGHSWGGAIVLKGGRRLDVERVIAIDPLIRQAQGTWAADFVDDLVPLFEAAPETRVPLIREMFAGEAPVVVDGKIHAMERMSIEPIVRLGAENHADDGGWDLRDDMRAYPKPLLLLLAEQSESVVSADDRAFVRENGGANVAVEVFEGEGHTLHRSAFDRFAASAGTFLRAT